MILKAGPTIGPTYIAIIIASFWAKASFVLGLKLTTQEV